MIAYYFIFHEIILDEVIAFYFDRITPMKVYFSEITLPTYSNSSSEAHLDDY